MLLPFDSIEFGSTSPFHILFTMISVSVSPLYLYVLKGQGAVPHSSLCLAQDMCSINTYLGKCILMDAD